MGTKIKTDFLFAMPSFIAGAGRALDIGATMQVYNESYSSQEADAKAIATDWKMVGSDIAAAIENYGKEK
mgnify:CR=1 FL=1